MNESLKRIYDLLEEQSTNGTEMCKSIGLKQSTWASWKGRDLPPGRDWVGPISEYLGVTVDYILNGTESEPAVLETKHPEPIDSRVQRLFIYWERLTADQKDQAIDFMAFISSKNEGGK